MAVNCFFSRVRLNQFVKGSLALINGIRCSGKTVAPLSNLAKRCMVVTAVPAALKLTCGFIAFHNNKSFNYGTFRFFLFDRALLPLPLLLLALLKQSLAQQQQ